jgi:hypothetical protein
LYTCSSPLATPPEPFSISSFLGPFFCFSPPPAPLGAGFNQNICNVDSCPRRYSGNHQGALPEILYIVSERKRYTHTHTHTHTHKNTALARLCVFWHAYAYAYRALPPFLPPSSLPSCVFLSLSLSTLAHSLTQTYIHIYTQEQAKHWEPVFLPWEEHFRGGLHAASHALINVLPLFARTSANDALTICDYPAARRYRPQVILIGDRYQCRERGCVCVSCVRARA